MSCILSKFYIKPQHFPGTSNRHDVVSYRNSTSNHNTSSSVITPSALYLIEILHQTTTGRRTSQIDRPLYLIEILHQTTTLRLIELAKQGCILSKFYIKPQPCHRHRVRWLRCILSKFYIKPQRQRRNRRSHNVVSYRNSTSNHNVPFDRISPLPVVSYRNSTSNHNSRAAGTISAGLYLIEILHQTTTLSHAVR